MTTNFPWAFKTFQCNLNSLCNSYSIILPLCHLSITSSLNVSSFWQRHFYCIENRSPATTELLPQLERLHTLETQFKKLLGL